MSYKREDIATFILEKLKQHREVLEKQFLESGEQIGFFYVDDLLPAELVREIYTKFPDPGMLTLKKSIREFKHVTAQMDQYHPLLEETLYAFQDKRIVDAISEICHINQLEPDHQLYAGGISMMSKDHFLNPHLDNSHDKERNRWRVLNLLYYVTQDWEESYGGNLEVWPQGVEEAPITIVSKFNRLAVMATHQDSWHSVSRVSVDKTRCCISNYYFSNDPLRESDRFHVTSFRGRPGEKFKDAILTLDAKARMLVRKFFKKGIVENKHVYKKDDFNN
ncbi:hypothetical protein GCM10009117_03370 [Gangjinia marincola]|uniref:Prolyl 4-hydroxylase alpha subunit Fe(2+) 2OG dioxygenase domain-containing protein n=1 Tax=Gangjinia marincola TaxID=578463 RepID=A0ABP3XTA6_9FLAO